MKVINVVFYKSESNSEPVREWLLSLERDDKKVIGQDIKTVELGWPIGMPVVRKLEASLWEVRSKLSGSRISRILFTVNEGQMVLLHGFMKKTQKTPEKDLTLARKRRNLILSS